MKAQDHALRAYARQRSLRQHVPIPVRPRSENNTPERSGGLASISSGENVHITSATSKHRRLQKKWLLYSSRRRLTTVRMLQCVELLAHPSQAPDRVPLQFCA